MSRRRLSFSDAGMYPGKLEAALEAEFERQLEAYEAEQDALQAREDEFERRQARCLTEVDEEELGMKRGKR